MGKGRELATAVWAYLRLEIPYLAQTLAEISLLVPLTLVLMPWARYWSPWVYFAILLCLMLLPFNLIRVLSLAGTAVGTQKLILSLTLLFAVVFALHTLLYENYPLLSLSWLGVIASHIRTSGYPFWQQDVTVLLIVLFVWWRGTRLLSRSTNIYLVGLELRLRLLVLAPIVALLAYWRLAWDVTPFLALTVGASLLLVPLARAEEAVQASDRAGLFELTPRWLLVVGGVNTAVVFLALWLAALPSQEQLFGPPQTALQLLTYTVILTLLQLLALPLFALLEILLTYLNILLAPIAQLLASLDFPLLPPLEEENMPPGAETIVQESNNPLAFLPILLFALFFLLIAFLIIYFTQRAVRRTHIQSRARRRPVQFRLDDEDADGGSLRILNVIKLTFLPRMNANEHELAFSFAFICVHSWLQPHQTLT
jgi:hypothetical protein